METELEDRVTRVRSRSEKTSIFGFNDLRKMKVMRKLKMTLVFLELLSELISK